MYRLYSIWVKIRYFRIIKSFFPSRTKPDFFKSLVLHLVVLEQRGHQPLMTSAKEGAGNLKSDVS